MATTSQTPSSIQSLRRFLTVVVCEFRFTQSDLEREGEAAVGQGLDAIWNVLADKARDNGGLVLPMHGSSSTVVFGYPAHDSDHAARAVQCVRQFIETATTMRNEMAWFPACGVGLHSADCLLVEQGRRTARSLSVSGPAAEGAAQLSHVARKSEALLSDSTLQAFCMALPPGIETLRCHYDEAPYLDGLNWDAVAFLELPERLQRESVLAGPNTASAPENAHYFFSYLFALRTAESRTPLNILSLQTSKQAVLFQLQLPDPPANGELPRLGSYTLLKKLGAANIGQVWLARDFHGTPVALKSLQGAYLGDERQIARLQREAEAMARLPHPNICRVLEVTENAEFHFIVMEYVNGCTLADIIRPNLCLSRKKETLSIVTLIHRFKTRDSADDLGLDVSGTSSLPYGETLEMFAKVCEAVAFAHEIGILHRDLKPGNILLRANGEPVVTDFGLVRMASADTANSASIHREVLGTLNYMAPEQAHDSMNVDERADIYSLGAILYVLVSGRQHFVTSSDIQKDASRLQTHEPRPLKRIVKGIHPDLALIVAKCLQPRTRDRYQTARMLRDDWQRFLLGQPILARPPSLLRLAKKWTSKHGSVVLTVAAAAFVIMLFAFYSFAQINRKRIAAEDALATARAAQARAEANEKRLIDTIKEATQNRLRADSAEFDKNQLVDEREKERTGLEKQRKELDQQQRIMKEQIKSFADASKHTTIEDLPREAPANSPEPPPIVLPVPHIASPIATPPTQAFGINTKPALWAQISAYLATKTEGIGMGTSPEKKQSPGTNAGVGTGTDNKISNLTGIENGQCTKPSIYDEGANGKRVGHIYIKSSKLGVIIDYSGGSKNSIDLARTQVKRFGNVTIKEMRGCAIGTGAHNDGQQGNIMPTVKTLISEKVDAIYWMCDLQDKEIPESVAALKTLLLDNHIKLYVYMTTQYDSAKNREAVIDIVKATGGALEYMTGHGVTIIK